MRSRILLVVLALLVTLAAVIAAPGRAEAWSNGNEGPDSFGTHDWVLQEANRLAKQKKAGWLKLSVALVHTDDPDSEFNDFYYHVYDVWGDPYGDAPAKVMNAYSKALAARKAGKIATASKWAGIMAHYYADICNPMHTDQTDAEDDIHSAYELDAQTLSDEPGENAGWAKFDGYTATKDVVKYTKTTAAKSHTRYDALVTNYASGGMNDTVVVITQKSLGLAANGLADLLISIKLSVKGKTTSGGGGGGSTTVYITETGTKYHRDGCRFLAKSKIPISLAKAKAEGYTACGVCKPPQ